MTNIVFKINFSLLLKIESFIINRYIISDINIANIAVNFPPTNIIKRLKIIIIILDDNSIKYNDGTKRNLNEGMLIAQYVIGLFCNIKIFNLGINLIESLISTASIKIIPALPNANYLTDQINKILKRKGNSC